MNKKILILLFSFFSISLFSQNTDSTTIQNLKKEIKQEQTTKKKINLLLKLGYLYEQINLDTAVSFYHKAQTIAEQKKDTLSLAKCYVNLGIANYFRSNYNEAIHYDLLAATTFKYLENKRGVANCYTNIGTVYSDKGTYDKAIKYYLKALKIYTEIAYKKGLSSTYNNIGTIYYSQRNYNKAMSYYTEAYKIDKSRADKIGMANYFNNIGAIYYNKKQYNKALVAYKKSLSLEQQLQDKSGIALSYSNIGLVYGDQGFFTKSIKNYEKAISYYKQIGNENTLALTYIHVATLKLKIVQLLTLSKTQKKQYLKESIQYANQAYQLAQKTHSLPRLKSALSQLYLAYELSEDYKKAMSYAKLYIAANDSLFNLEKHKALAEMEAKYQYNKRIAIDSIANAKKDQIQKLEIAKIKAENKRQNAQNNLFLVAISLLILIIGLILWFFFKNKKTNKLLKQQQKSIFEKNTELSHLVDEITTQRDMVNQQKEQITLILKAVSQSIDYAKKIQNATLPKAQYLQKNFSDYFILFKPRDIVSGDFYWWAEVEGEAVIAAADCTGHGVPGAIMSMLGMSLLKEIVVKEYISHPGVILRRLRKEIINTLQQKGEIGEQKDGMDMALISINLQTKELQFSGANNPLFIITERTLQIDKKFVKTFNVLDSEKTLYEISPDKMPISIYDKMERYTTHKITLEEGDQLYMFSDGYADQFGGEKGKKFMKKAFKKILLKNAHLSMKKQNEILTKTFELWKEKEEQIDDVLVMGICI